MIYDEICKLRKELNESILQDSDYTNIYEISVKLDNLIAEYYTTQININNKSIPASEKMLKET